MTAVSSFIWIIGFALSVLIAPQLRIWTWGPTMVCFAVSTLLALPALRSETKNRSDLVLVICGLTLVSWLVLRGAFSPVVELALSDILLVAMAVSTFVTFRAVSRDRLSQGILTGGIALLSLASACLVFYQVKNTDFAPIFGTNASLWPSGFFAHYSYGASFLIAVSMLLAGIALHGKERGAVRWILGLIAVSALAAIYFTNSRGAFAGAACGIAVLGLGTVMKGKRENKKWFVPAVFALPFLVIAVGILLIHGWQDAQAARNATDTGVTNMMDNSVRLYLLNIAVSCIQLHPWVGGGARSFSWECFRFWDYKSMGEGTNRPEHVHNELVQTAVDYGIIGAALLVIFLICILITATYRLAVKGEAASQGHGDAWRIGGLAGFTGLFVQSNVEGIFRIPPGAILLALCLAAACFPSSGSLKGTSQHRPWFRSGLIGISGLAAIVALSFWGWKGTRATTILWPAFFGKIPMGFESRIAAISDALPVWSLESLYEYRGNLYHDAALTDPSEETSRIYLEFAVSDFRKASELNPYNPTTAVSSANLLSAMKRNTEAEKEYNRAIALQGGMEAGFQSHFMLAKHLHRKALRQFELKNSPASLSSFQSAVRHIDKAFESPSVHQNREDLELRVLIHENYGKVLELSGKNKEAMAHYDAASQMSYGETSHYHAAVLFGEIAVKVWSERRPEDAMRLFMLARHRIGFASSLPDGITPEKRDIFQAYLEKTTQYLQGAKVTPSEKVDF